MIDLEKQYLEDVKRILRRHVPDCEVRVFGSRVTGPARKYSDLDLVIVGRKKIDWRKIEELKDAFSESDLPFMVDVLDLHAISSSFRELIEKQYEVIQRPEVFQRSITS